MSFQVAGHQTEKYQVATSVYEGPLDLLLELIERAELDITRLALAQVTDQYLEYLRSLQERNAAEVSAFLVIAARLLQIKSAALLPRPPIDHSGAEEEDPGEALARQLILYKRFKELAGYLRVREEAGLQTHLRLAAPPKFATQIKLDLSGITLVDFMDAARAIFFNKAALTSLDKVVSMPRVTIREKIRSILGQLRGLKSITFRNLLNGGTPRVEIIVTFLAMLELIKRHIVSAEQSSLFGDIALESLTEMSETDDIPFEFDEEHSLEDEE
ncbi:MAG TPA: segregation/condensation protein A [Bellilinea sp.]|nr:segregation/condensation protein A [Bellilinea sp.]